MAQIKLNPPNTSGRYSPRAAGYVYPGMGVSVFTSFITWFVKHFTGRLVWLRTSDLSWVHFAVSLLRLISKRFTFDPKMTSVHTTLLNAGRMTIQLWCSRLHCLLLICCASSGRSQDLPLLVTPASPGGTQGLEDIHSQPKRRLCSDISLDRL